MAVERLRTVLILAVFMPQGTLYYNLLTTTLARRRTAFEVLPYHNDLIQTRAWLL
jgi:hypothetical protein